MEREAINHLDEAINGKEGYVFCLMPQKLLREHSRMEMVNMEYSHRFKYRDQRLMRQISEPVLP